MGWAKNRHCKEKSQSAFVAEARKKEDAHGLIFGYSGKGKQRTYYYAPEGSEGSALILGAPGTGKTASILISSLLSLTSNGQNGVRGSTGSNAYVIDLAGDISRNVKLQNKIEYKPASDDNTIKYNVFAAVDDAPTVAKKNQELMRLANLIMPPIKNETPNAKYFQDGGRDIFKAALIAYYHQGLDFPDICSKIVKQQYSDLFSEIDSSGNEDAKAHINKFLKSNEANISGCKENVDSAVMLFAMDENAKNALGRDNSFSPKDFEETSIFIIIAENMLLHFTSLLRVVTSQFLDYYSARSLGCTKDLIFALDEFATIGLSSDDILHVLRLGRKRRLKVWVCCQSLIDLDVLYGRDVRLAMCDNFLFTVALSCRTVETQRYISDLIGQEEYERESFSSVSPLSKGSKNISIERRNIIEPSALANLGDELIVLFPGGYLRLKKNYYFAD